jgi:hypothetical protein
MSLPKRRGESAESIVTIRCSRLRDSANARSKRSTAKSTDVQLPMAKEANGQAAKN